MRRTATVVAAGLWVALVVGGCTSTTADVFVLGAEPTEDLLVDIGVAIDADLFTGRTDATPTPPPSTTSVSTACTGTGLVACYLFDGDTSASPLGAPDLVATEPLFEPGVPGAEGEALTTTSRTDAVADGAAFELDRLSLDAWIYVDGRTMVPPERYIANRGSSWAARLQVIQGLIAFSCATPLGSSFAGPVSPDAWHHIACVWDGSTVMAYLDGVQALPAATGLAGAGAEPLRVGHSGFADDAPLVGGIDQLRFWDRVLTRQEVVAAAAAPQ